MEIPISLFICSALIWFMTLSWRNYRSVMKFWAYSGENSSPAGIPISTHACLFSIFCLAFSLKKQVRSIIHLTLRLTWNKSKTCTKVFLKKYKCNTYCNLLFHCNLHVLYFGPLTCWQKLGCKNLNIRNYSWYDFRRFWNIQNALIFTWN